MTKAVQFRVARREDAHVLSELAMASKGHWGYSAEFMAYCQDELAISAEEISAEGYCCVVAEREGAILGFYALQKLSKREVELDAMFVHPRHIGTGIGRRLMEHAQASAAEMDAECILVQSDPNAEAFYRRTGAEVIGSKESVSIPGRYLPLLRFSC